ncbi:hypothetical protein Tco_0390805 [Tanacetum coccineum]
MMTMTKSINKSLVTKSKRFFKKGTQRFSGAKATDQTECHKCGRKAVSKEGARNGEWVKISMRKVHTLLEMEDNDEIMNLLDYLCIDLIYAEEQRNNLLSKHKDLVGIKSLHDDLRVTAAQMDQDSAHMVAALKVSMLKPGEYELWRMRMEQLHPMIELSHGKSIENGNATSSKKNCLSVRRQLLRQLLKNPTQPGGST